MDSRNLERNSTVISPTEGLEPYMKIGNLTLSESELSIFTPVVRGTTTGGGGFGGGAVAGGGAFAGGAVTADGALSGSNQGVLPQPPPSEQQLKLTDMNLMLMFDPHGDMHAIDKETDKHLWTAKTGRPAFKLCKDEEQVLNPCFEFDRSEDHNNDIYFIFNETCVKVDDNLSLSSLTNLVNEQCGPQGLELDVKGKTEEIWINLLDGDLKYNPFEDYVRMDRKDFTICNQCDNWELNFSIFEFVEGLRDTHNIKLIHCRYWEGYCVFMQRFGIPLETLTVFYDTRHTWEDGRVTFRGKFNKRSLLLCDDAFMDANNSMDITAEAVLPGEAMKVNQYFLFLGSHRNILRFYGGYKSVEQDTYLVFESYAHSLKTPGKEDPDKHRIVSAILSGVLHLYNRDRIHGSLKEHNVLITANNEIKLYGLLYGAPIPSRDKNAESDELVDLGNLLLRTFFNNGELLSDYKLDNPVLYDLLKKLISGRLSIRELEMHIFFWEHEKALRFYVAVALALDDYNSGKEEGWDRDILEEELRGKAFQNFIFQNRGGDLHLIFMKHMDQSTMYRRFGPRGVEAMVRFMRNSYAHFATLEPMIKELFGETLEGLGKYYAEVHPHFLPEVYNLIDQLVLEYPGLYKIFWPYCLEGRTVEAKPGSNVGRRSGRAGNYRKKIYVGGLPTTLTEEQFRQYFQRYGDVRHVVIMFDPNTQRPRGFGFITFETEDVVDIVLQQTFHVLNNKDVVVKRALPKDATPGGRGRGRGCGYQGNNSSGSFDRKFDGNRFLQQSAGDGYPAYSGYGQPYGSYGVGGYGSGNAGYDSLGYGPNVGCQAYGYLGGNPGAMESPWYGPGYGSLGYGSNVCQPPTGYASQVYVYGNYGSNDGYNTNPGRYRAAAGRFGPGGAASGDQQGTGSDS